MTCYTQKIQLLKVTLKMNNYALVIDISSDEENQRYSTPIKTLPLNMVGRQDLSDSSVESGEAVKPTLTRPHHLFQRLSPKPLRADQE